MDSGLRLTAKLRSPSQGSLLPSGERDGRSRSERTSRPVAPGPTRDAPCQTLGVTGTLDPRRQLIFSLRPLSPRRDAGLLGLAGGLQGNSPPGSMSPTTSYACSPHQPITTPDLAEPPAPDGAP